MADTTTESGARARPPAQVPDQYRQRDEPEPPEAFQDDEDDEEATEAFADLELEDDGMPAPEDLTDGLRAVVDPEIGYNIVDLGLVYEVTKPEPGKAHVLMTLTSMGCPLTEVIHEQCSVILGAMPGVEDVEVEFTFSPPWDPSMVADYVAEELRAMGMNI